MNPLLSPFASARNSSSHNSSSLGPNAFLSLKQRLHGMPDDHYATSVSSSHGRPDVRAAAAAAAATEDDPRVVKFRNLFKRSDTRLASFLRNGPVPIGDQITGSAELNDQPSSQLAQPTPNAKKRPARVIDEDDYGDDDEEDEEATLPPATESPLMQRTLSAISNVSSQRNASPLRRTLSPMKPQLSHRASATTDIPRSSDDARKKAQQEKQAAEEAAKRDFHTMFYTLEHDHAAMLEQQKLDELDRQVEAEVSNDRVAQNGVQQVNGAPVGTLSSANLGASSLMLKHLLSRMDKCRHMINAQDSQLRRLISEVRKNRSKWASEEKVGQEELYESAEKVLLELKAMTEYSAPFLGRVSKREAPDYYHIIKSPMDIGTMQKKLKGFSYTSKKQFVEDLNLIWNNCLRYNSDPAHPLRKKALYMQKQTESLVFLIPDIVIRDRKEVEAEERKMQHLDAELDGADDSDDEPIMASRGRKAPSKAKKGVASARKSSVTGNDDPADTKPLFADGSRRADSDAPTDVVMNGVSSPGNLTPLAGVNGIHASSHSQADGSDLEVNGFNMGDLAQNQELEYADSEFRTWKQVTKKSRALAAAERNKLFVNHRINPDEPALLRSKAGMRRFARLHQDLMQSHSSDADSGNAGSKENAVTAVPGQTLTEGVEAADDHNILPDYYDSISAIPDVDGRLTWDLDDEGMVVNHYDDCLRRLQPGLFTTPVSAYSQKMDANMRLIQDTRKICSKINVVKQMQLQVQIYQNQFQKYDPQPFVEADVETVVVSNDGPIMAPEVCRAALQRSISKVFFNAGFTDCQATALETATDYVTDHLQGLAKTFASFFHTPKLVTDIDASGAPVLRQRFSAEESLLHTFSAHSLDLDGLDSYVTDDVERMSTKLAVMQERMKQHLADILRPVLDPSTGTDGVGAFNDGSEQFVSGDFAEDMNEDFFGFRELGLDKEFSMDNLSVPFHLLHNRMQNAYATQNTTTTLSGDLMEQPEAFEAVSTDLAKDAVGIVQQFFLHKISEHDDEPLIEDDELPQKQRFPKPRLPPSGKITSPRKRPPKEQAQLARKKRKLEEGREEVLMNGAASNPANPTGDLKLDAPVANAPVGDPEKDDDATGMMSPPESL